MIDHAAAIEGCARGDRQSLKRLYEAEAGRLIAVALRIVRRRDIAEEVVQEAFLQIWRKAGSYDPELGSARGWITTIVRNRALNVIRDGAREDLVDAHEIAELGERTSGVEDAVAQLSTNSKLKRCLDELDRAKRLCVLFSYVGGYSHGEIAGALGVPIGTAKAWVRRGLLALRDCMG